MGSRKLEGEDTEVHAKTEHLINRAANLLKQHIEDRQNDPLAFGETNISLRWQGGQITHVSEEIKGDYKK